MSAYVVRVYDRAGRFGGTVVPTPGDSRRFGLGLDPRTGNRPPAAGIVRGWLAATEIVRDAIAGGLVPPGGNAIADPIETAVPDAIADAGDAIRDGLAGAIADRVRDAVRDAIPDAVSAALDPDRDLPFGDEIPADEFVLEFADQ